MCNAHTRTLANSRTQQKKQTAECMCGNAGRKMEGWRVSLFCYASLSFFLALSFAFFLFALRPLCYFCSHLLIYQGTRAQKNATKNVPVLCICISAAATFGAIRQSNASLMAASMVQLALLWCLSFSIELSLCLCLFLYLI